MQTFKSTLLYRIYMRASLLRDVVNQKRALSRAVTKAVHNQLAAESKTLRVQGAPTVMGRTKRRHREMCDRPGGVEEAARNHLDVLVESCEVLYYTLLFRIGRSLSFLFPRKYCVFITQCLVLYWVGR